MKLIWGLQNKVKNEFHSPYVYDMFYLSIQMAKEIGYETILYGTSDAIEKLGEYVDEVYNTDELEYKLFDDLKVHIWRTRTDDYLTIDGDVFLHSPLVFDTNLNPFVSFDMVVSEQTNGYQKECLDILNNLNISDIIPEWNESAKLAYSTGLVRWKGNNGILKYYLESYDVLKKWFLQSETLISEMNSELNSNKSLISHYICEHLLHRVVDYYELKYEILNENINNSYYHWQGNDKFTNEDKFNCVKNVVDTHKKMGGTIKDVYVLLLKNGIIKPILYP